MRALIDLVDGDTTRDQRRTDFRSRSVRRGLHALVWLFRGLGAFLLLQRYQFRQEPNEYVRPRIRYISKIADKATTIILGVAALRGRKNDRVRLAPLGRPALGCFSPLSGTNSSTPL